MANEVEQYKANCLTLCNKLLSALEENRMDATRFFGEDIYRSYAAATDRVISETKQVRNKIRNL